MKMRWLLVVATAGLLIGCTPKPKKMRDPVQRDKREKLQQKQNNSAPAQLGPETCNPFKVPNIEAPVYLRVGDGGFVLTRVMKSCVTRDGVRGFEDGSPWMAMGIPCTAGKGQIEIRGRSYAPKMISFNMSTDCSMSPDNPDMVNKVTNARLGFTDANKLLAYNPFSVQYWEVEGFRDAGVGDAVELRSINSIKSGWIDFKDKNKPLVVQLYGRENAWVQDAKVFNIKAELNFQRPMNFELKVLEVRVLNESEQKAANQRCLAFGLRRRCADVFN